MSALFDLFLNLFGRLTLFALIFIFMMRLDAVRRLMTGKATSGEKLLLCIACGALGILATYGGVPVQGAIANSRVVPVALGAVLGGPLVGAAAGALAGAHRYLIDIGGFTAAACGVATAAEGFLAGVLYHRLKNRPFDAKAALIMGVSVEVLQMIIILLVAKPFNDAVSLVNSIGVPMIVVNGLGCAVFVELISSVSREQERVAASQAQTALRIASRTLPFLRNGLNRSSAAETARIILEMTDLDAVSLTDGTEILAHEGAEKEHHIPGNPLMTRATRDVLATGRLSMPVNRVEIGCREPDCRLGSAIIVPLNRRNKKVGTLKLYRLKEGGISSLDMELADGLAHLFSTQLELAEVEHQRKLLADAEIRMLQAQINPHFLFNAINTIISYTRTDPRTASELLLKLSDFFRKNINPAGDIVPLSSEIAHCQSYIAIEKARFEDRLTVNYAVDNTTLDCRVPPLILQPLVENALRHGILPKEEGGAITIGVSRDNGSVRISVTDTGRGMTGEQVEFLLSEKSPQRSSDGLGIALRNVNARLTALYGPEHGLVIKSELGKGTVVSFSIPGEGSGPQGIHN